MAKRIAVLGGGITGLSATWKLAEKGFEVDLIEKEDQVGGLVRSIRRNGNIFDYGPHAFHTQDPELMKEFIALMGGEENLVPQKKSCQIKFQGKYFNYPLKPEQVFFSLPFHQAAACAFGFVWTVLKNQFRKPISTNAEEWFLNHFGRPIYDIYFGPYTARVWGMSAKELSAAFVARTVPEIKVSTLLRRYFLRKGEKFKAKTPHDIPEELAGLYPKEGCGQYPDRIHEKILGHPQSRIHLKAKVAEIVLDSTGRQVEAVRFEKNGILHEVPCDYLVSTVPLPILVQAFGSQLNHNIQEFASFLTYRSLVMACLIINRERVIQPQAIYFNNRFFNRISQMNSYSPFTAPLGKSGLIAEKTCDEGDEIWNMPEKEFCDRMIKDLVEEGVIRPEEVEDSFVLKLEHAYPVYLKGYEEKLETVAGQLADILNLYTGGRQGGFNYIQMQFAMSSGFKIAEHIASGKPKTEIPDEIKKFKHFR